MGTVHVSLLARVRDPALRSVVPGVPRSRGWWCGSRWGGRTDRPSTSTRGCRRVESSRSTGGPRRRSLAARVLAVPARRALGARSLGVAVGRARDGPSAWARSSGRRAGRGGAPSWGPCGPRTSGQSSNGPSWARMPCWAWVCSPVFRHRVGRETDTSSSRWRKRRNKTSLGRGGRVTVVRGAGSTWVSPAHRVGWAGSHSAIPADAAMRPSTSVDHPVYQRRGILLTTAGCRDRRPAGPGRRLAARAQHAQHQRADEHAERHPGEVGDGIQRGRRSGAAGARACTTSLSTAVHREDRRDDPAAEAGDDSEGHRHEEDERCTTLSACGNGGGPRAPAQ